MALARRKKTKDLPSRGKKKNVDKERMKKIWKESPPRSNHNGGKSLTYSKRERFV